MITTRSSKLAKRLHLLRTHGITKELEEMAQNDGGWFYEMQSLGMNYRIPDILCALGISQLKRIDSNLRQRREIARNYDEAFAGLPIKTPSIPKGINHAYHLYVIRVPQRKELYEHLKSKGIYCQVHYIPIYQQPFYIHKYGVQSFIQMESYYQQAISIPMFHGMTSIQQKRVIDEIRAFFK
jgi:dTDP-4-amino-4,6-dideoxygalactose transaminase